MRHLLICIILLTATGPWALAQNEIEKEVNSLSGINRFYAVVNIEASQKITDSPEVDVVDIQKAVGEQLRSSGLQVLSNEESVKRKNYPYLYIHINAMENATGYIPFSVEADFFQPVKLTLNRDKQMMASTWENSLVAIISPDRFDLLKKSAVSVAKDFVSDYKHVNNMN